MTTLPPATRQFTLDEANRTLPLVRRIVRDIVVLFADVQQRFERLSDIEGDPDSISIGGNSLSGDELREMQADLDADQDRLRDFFHELAEIGAELKDPITGLVDFPTVVDGVDAYLCWKLGEDEIGFWHRQDTGFAGRHSVHDATQIGPHDDSADLII
ncbi:MAG: DUF2203 family protein [Planctomycetota bacterium]|nr:MAG: DUF2203 family protein [Planctomycetota bacterium]REJ88645.1 MAG: DUF2203 family protein [Planctomycetota bacterium]REK27205.1 MAG: DUF2203 family protein [Planctomycetota bacterium]REK36774.1 MAG: DUF2203 family protein [Planctomycetota bacterium]